MKFDYRIWVGSQLHRIVNRWRKNSTREASRKRRKKGGEKQGGVKIADFRRSTEDYDHCNIFVGNRSLFRILRKKKGEGGERESTNQRVEI